MDNVEQVELFGRLMLALALGSAIGAEREFRGHEAGLRTSGLVCLGAATFGEVASLFASDRVAAGVVQGVGFLGAGLIFVRNDNISGVTTAATVWVLAGLGLLVSADLWLAALLLTMATIGLLELAPISDWVYRNGRRHAGEPDVSKEYQPEPEGRAKIRPEGET